MNVLIPKWMPGMMKLVLNLAWQIPLMTTKCGLMIGEFASSKNDLLKFGNQEYFLIQ